MAALGAIIIVVGLVLVAVGYGDDTVENATGITRLAYGMTAGGPVLIVGAVLLAAGSIVAALSRR